MPTYIALDTETHLIRPGVLTPRLVCVSAFTGSGEPVLMDREAGLSYVRWVLDPSHKDWHVLIHNAAFDLAVFCNEDPDLLPLVLDAYAAGRVHCTLVRGKMVYNAIHGLKDDEGKPVLFSLADEVMRRFGVDLSHEKKDPNSWRTRYAELDGVPIDQWPAEAVQYAKDDALWHYRVWESQEQERVVDVRGVPTDALFDEPGQTWSAFFLHLMGCWGLLTEEAQVQTLIAHLEEVVEAAYKTLRRDGIVKGKAVTDRATGRTTVEWSKNTKAIQDRISAFFGGSPPRTAPTEKFPAGQIKTDGDTLMMTDDPLLHTLAEVSADAKALSVWGDALQGKNKKGVQTGLRTPEGWLLQPKWNALVASGRTSVYDPPVQQLPRKGDVRPCFVPRPGMWYLSVDYTAVELVAWAQVCLDLFGFSMMAEALRRGLDPHVDMGAEILRAEGKAVTYDDLERARKAGEAWAKDARQMAKAANFGFPGGLGAATFVRTARDSYGVTLTEDSARGLKRTWQGKWPEATPYFAHFSDLSGAGNGFTTILPRARFVRAGCTYTSGCNTMFQGLAARGAKQAMLPIMRECYVDERSPLFGSRPVLFIHDEFILEVPAHRERAHRASERLCKLMIDGMQQFTPDVPVKVEPTLMRRWYKEAGPVWGKDGVLEVWEPKVPTR